MELHCIINPHLLTHKQDEAGPLVELHRIGLAELQNRSRVPGKESAFWVIQHLHTALSCDHVTLSVQKNQRRNTWRKGRKKGEDGVRGRQTEEGRKCARAWVISDNYHFMTLTVPSSTEIFFFAVWIFLPVFLSHWLPPPL